MDTSSSRYDQLQFEGISSKPERRPTWRTRMITDKKDIPKIEVRQMKETDLSAAMEIKDAEGWNQTLEDWQFFLNQDPYLCVVATHEQKTIATVTAVGYESKLAWIGMMLVRNDFRGLGIGKLLMENILKKLAGFPAIKLDATPAGLPLYEKIGFVREYSILRSVCPAVSVETENRPEKNRLRPVLPEHLEAIANYDKGIFGINRKVVLAYLMTRSSESAWLAEDGQTIKGYLLGRPGSNYFQLGPLVADSTETAIQLLQQALTKHQGQPVVVDLISGKDVLLNWLQLRGFTVRRELTRMYYRNNPFPEDLSRHFLIAGPELG